MKIPKSVKPKIGIKGADIVMNNLNREIQNIKGASMKGLILSAILIRRDMEDTPPLIPVDTGNLRASWFTATSTGEGEEGNGASFQGKKAEEMQLNHGAVTKVASGIAQASDYPLLVMGFSANYATFVHEMVDFGRGEGNIVGINWKRPDSGPKFFESALKRNKDKILETIKKNVEIPD